MPRCQVRSIGGEFCAVGDSGQVFGTHGTTAAAQEQADMINAVSAHPPPNVGVEPGPPTLADIAARDAEQALLAFNASQGEESVDSAPDDPGGDSDFAESPDFGDDPDAVAF